MTSPLNMTKKKKLVTLKSTEENKNGKNWLNKK